MKTSSSFFWRALTLLAFTATCQLPAADSPAANSKNGYTVNVEVKVSETGEVEEVDVLNSDEKTPDDILKKMAAAMALKTNFPPRPKNGAPAKYKARVPFFFPIEDDEGAAANDLPLPKVKEIIQPVYPANLREQGAVGGAVLEMVVDAQGKLTRLTTLRASHPEFEASAVESIKKWTFTPAQKDGKAVESRSRVAIVFDTKDAMADLKWRIAPRPAFGSFVLIKPGEPIQDADVTAPTTPPAAQPAPGK